MDIAPQFLQLGLALGLGLLVGMQRERAQTQVAGVRTFALITMLGTLCAMLAETLGGWIVVGGLVTVSAATVVGSIVKIRKGVLETGVTTHIAVLVMFLVGAYIVVGRDDVAIVVGAAVAVLLYAKPVLHGFVLRIGETDMRAMMQFVLIALVILPVLPDRPYGPFNVVNPREIWMLVVLIVAISLAGYVALKLFGERVGIVLTGLLGGVISSTATTASYSRRAASGVTPAAATLVIMLASTVVYVRVAALVAVVAPSALPSVVGPIGMMFTTAAVLSLLVLWRYPSPKGKIQPQNNPAELKTAIVFAALFAAISFAVAAAEYYFGKAGILVVAGISGLTDMDAITLSVSRMISRDGVSVDTAWRAIVIAIMANMVFKTIVAGSLGGRKLLARVAPLFAINIAVGVGLLLFWPTVAATDQAAQSESSQHDDTSGLIDRSDPGAGPANGKSGGDIAAEP